MGTEVRGTQIVPVNGVKLPSGHVIVVSNGTLFTSTTIMKADDRMKDLSYRPSTRAERNIYEKKIGSGDHVWTL